MISQEQVSQLMGATAYDRSGEKVGKIGQVYLDNQTGEPTFVTVNSGLFGTTESFVPIGDANFYGDGVTVAFDKALITDAPKVTPDGGDLSPQEEAELYRHYGMAYSEGGGDDAAMTRSEEQLRVGTRQVEAGRARLRKYVVTEQQQVPVTTTREEVRVEREPITDENRDAALSGPDISEEEHEVVLHEEQPVVQTQAVPVERVRLDVDQVSEEQTVSGEVRKEQIDLDADDERVR